MKIEIKYSTSQAPHSMEFEIKDLKEIDKNTFVISQPTPKGDKEMIIYGEVSELKELAKLLSGQ